MLADTTKCGSDVQGIELVNTNGFLYCYSILELMLQHNEKYRLPGRKVNIKTIFKTVESLYNVTPGLNERDVD